MPQIEDAMPDADVIAQRIRLYEAAIDRSTVDPEFRSRLVAAPRETLDALAARLGLAAAPTGIEIDIVEVTPLRLQLLLPPLAATPLDEDQLAAVVGGSSTVPNRLGSAAMPLDPHGCPACPHPAVGSFIRR